jgi:hypothetical protein
LEYEGGAYSPYYVCCCLQERNTLENVQKWACGRPAPSELATISDAPDEAGLMDLDPGLHAHPTVSMVQDLPDRLLQWQGAG